jgi:NTE family protein
LPLNVARCVADAAAEGSDRALSVFDQGSAKTAFVFAGGGSFGAIQVGMLHSLAAHGISADMVVGSSVGALNGAFYAGDPTLEGVQRLGAIWRGLQRHDVFPLTWKTLLGFVLRRDFLITHDGIRKLIDDQP